MRTIALILLLLSGLSCKPGVKDLSGGWYVIRFRPAPPVCESTLEKGPNFSPQFLLDNSRGCYIRYYNPGTGILIIDCTEEPGIGGKVNFIREQNECESFIHRQQII